jgi:hypothetical protein
VTSSLRDAARPIFGEAPISVRQIATDAGLTLPVSLSAVIDLLIHPLEVSKDADVTTPAGTALSGNVRFTFRSDGTWSYHSQMSAEGLTSYDYDVTGLYATTSGLTFTARSNGHVQGTIGSGPRRDYKDQSGTNPIVRTKWPEIADGTVWVTKQYDMTGIIGFIDDVYKDILDIAATVAGAAAGVVIGLSRDFFQVLGKGGISETLGVLAGIAVFLSGGGFVLAATSGAAAGLVSKAFIKSRDVRDDEAALIKRVFGGSLDTSKIQITDLSGLSGRAFTLPGVDGYTYVNIGDAFDDPLTYTNDAYPMGGELLIHEMTHAWQIQWAPTEAGALPGVVCRGIVNQVNYTVGEDVYAYGEPDLRWFTFNLEAQAAIVDQWYAGIPTPAVPNRKASDVNDPYFHYITDNIRVGRAV